MTIRPPDEQGPSLDLQQGAHEWDEPCASLHSSNPQFAADSGTAGTSDPMLEGTAPMGVTPRSPVPPLDPSYATHPSALSFPTQPPALSSCVQFQVIAPTRSLHSQIPIRIILNQEENNPFCLSCLLGNSKTCFGCDRLKDVI